MLLFFRFLLLLLLLVLLLLIFGLLVLGLLIFLLLVLLGLILLVVLVLFVVLVLLLLLLLQFFQSLFDKVTVELGIRILDVELERAVVTLDSLFPVLLLLLRILLVLALTELGVSKVVVSTLLDGEILGDERRVQMAQCLVVILVLKRRRTGVEMQTCIVGLRLERALIFRKCFLEGALLILLQRPARPRLREYWHQSDDQDRKRLRQLGSGRVCAGFHFGAIRQQHFN